MAVLLAGSYVGLRADDAPTQLDCYENELIACFGGSVRDNLGELCNTLCTAPKPDGCAFDNTSDFHAVDTATPANGEHCYPAWILYCSCHPVIE
jgi:hypothetical protein